MDPQTLRAVLIPLHGVFGIVALSSGLAALLLRKKRGRHTQFGLAFFGFLMAAIASAVPVIALSQNLFLAGLGSIALYLAVMGYRIGTLRPPLAPPSRGDWACVWVGLVGFAAFALWGIRVLVGGHSLGIVVIALGALGASSAWKHRRFFADPQGDPADWMEQHGGTLGGAVIAASSAFSVAALSNWFPDFPEWIFWLAPVVLLIPVLNKQIKRGAAA